jgi:hypothetical protein
MRWQTTCLKDYEDVLVTCSHVLKALIRHEGTSGIHEYRSRTEGTPLPNIETQWDEEIAWYDWFSDVLGENKTVVGEAAHPTSPSSEANGFEPYRLNRLKPSDLKYTGTTVRRRRK